MLTPEVIEVPFLSFPSPCKRPWGEGEERNVGTSITSFSSFSCLLFLCHPERARRMEKIGNKQPPGRFKPSFSEVFSKQCLEKWRQAVSVFVFSLGETKTLTAFGPACLHLARARAQARDKFRSSLASAKGNPGSWVLMPEN